MKRCFTLLVSLILAMSPIVPAYATTRAPTPPPTLPPVWDGSTAGGFASGSGTEYDPYIIRNASQLAYLKKWNQDNPNPERSYYFTIAEDIRFNDETVEFDPDTGLVTVTGDTNAYLGTGICGKSGGNTTFDTVASEAGAWYSSNDSLTKIAPPQSINYWEPFDFGPTAMGAPIIYINTLHNGSMHDIIGLFVNSSSDNNGLFSTLNGVMVNFLDIKDSVVIGRNNNGLIAGGGRCHIQNSYSNGVVIGQNNTGGIIGNAQDLIINYKDYSNLTAYPTAYDTYTNVVVSGWDNVGGIAGAANYLSIVSASGYVLGQNNVGGIAGSNQGGYITYGDCDATVYGKDNVGGIAGRCQYSTISACAYGPVYYYYRTSEMTVNGEDYVGGVVGYALDTTVKRSCATTSNHVNDSSLVKGEKYVGGIAGLLASSKKYNLFSSISDAYFCDGVEGTKYVGGIVGATAYPSGDKGYNGYNLIQRCIGSNRVNGQSDAGRIAGKLCYKNELSNCYYEDMDISPNGAKTDVPNIPEIKCPAITNEKGYNDHEFEGFSQTGDNTKMEQVWYLRNCSNPPKLENLESHKHMCVGGAWQRDGDIHRKVCTCAGCNVVMMLGEHDGTNCSVCTSASPIIPSYSPSVTPTINPTGNCVITRPPSHIVTSSPTPPPKPGCITKSPTPTVTITPKPIVTPTATATPTQTATSTVASAPTGTVIYVISTQTVSAEPTEQPSGDAEDTSGTNTLIIVLSAAIVTVLSGSGVIIGSKRKHKQ